MSEKRHMIRQHEPLRVPHGWGEPGRSFVMQLERIFDDIYKQFSIFGTPKKHSDTSTKKVYTYELPGGLLITTIRKKVTVDITSTSGNNYYATVGGEPFPIPYAEPPVVVHGTSKDETSAWALGNTTPTTSVTGSMYIVRGTSVSNKTIWVQWIAVGYKGG